jgi:hypothetical protein
VIRVQIDANSDTTHRHAILNDAVIPEVKALSGFQAETWMNDGVGTGMCIVVFDNDEHARAAMISLTAPGGRRCSTAPSIPSRLR